MRKTKLLLFLVCVGAGICLWGVWHNQRVHRLEVRAVFADAKGIRAGAPVRISGVNVGRVATVRKRPDLGPHAAELVMQLQTSYDLIVPSNASVTVAKDGLLGPPYPNINIIGVSGPPVENGGTLKTD